LTDSDTFTLFNVQPGGTFSATPTLASGQNWWTTNNYQTLTYNVWPTAGNPNFTRAKSLAWKIFRDGCWGSVTETR
jgi:hypothetical protein